MTSSLSKLHDWFDGDFFELGAFLTTNDGQEVLIAKGGSYSRVEKFLTLEKTVFYLKDFYQNNYLAYIPNEVIKFPKDEVPFLQVEHSHFSPLSNDDDLYEKDFHTLKSVFQQGVEKVVLISRESFGSFEGEKTIRHLFNRAFSFGTGLPYGIWNKSYGVIGSTPELLFDIEGETLKTFALAGTAQLGEEALLIDSAKDRHEHNLVIQDIKEKIAPYVTDLNIQETKIHPFKSIIHLKTQLEGKIQGGVDLTALTNLMSPTAALGGYPKGEALAFLKSSHYSNHYPLRYFGSAFGVISGSHKEFIVSIRNVQWESAHLFIESGGGIVPESEFQKELDEIHLKRNTIRKHYL